MYTLLNIYLPLFLILSDCASHPVAGASRGSGWDCTTGGGRMSWLKDYVLPSLELQATIHWDFWYLFLQKIAAHGMADYVARLKCSSSGKFMQVPQLVRFVSCLKNLKRSWPPFSIAWSASARSSRPAPPQPRWPRRPRRPTPKVRSRSCQGCQGCQGWRLRSTLRMRRTVWHMESPWRDVITQPQPLLINPCCGRSSTLAKIYWQCGHHFWGC